jgi:hypothetical protein
MNEETVEQTDSSIGQKFQYEVEKETAKKGITFEYSERAGERLRVEVVDDVPFIVANRAGMLALAKLLLKVGAGRRNTGFQLYLREDFDSDRDKVLRILLEEEATEDQPAEATALETLEKSTTSAA